ncbi:MAG: zinc ABC transporter substrate-binding protein [Gammaproteobacteria bacterium]
MKPIIGIIVVFGLFTAPAHAALDVVATTANMGALARIVGDEHVSVIVLVPPDRDAHYLEARPSMMAALRRADVLVAVGAALEVGWLPAALRGAGNRKVVTGSRGYFEAAATIELIETGEVADRGRGDVHPGGNPHFYLDPVRFAAAAVALATRLAELDPTNAADFHANAAAFATKIDDRVSTWRARLADAPAVVAYHKDVNYLFDRFGIEVVGYIEPLPGIPPTARHLASLVAELRGEDGLIVHLPFQPANGPAFIARELGWPVVQQASNVAVDGGEDAYLALVDAWVDALGQSAR